MKKAVWNGKMFQLGFPLVILLFGASTVIAAGNWQRLYPWYPTNGYNAVYAQSSGNVFAVGNNGLICHYDGSVWSEMESPVTVSLKAVWGRAPDDVFAVGAGGAIIHYNGVRWQEMSSPTDQDLYCVWGFSESNSAVYAGGRNGDILVYSAGTWSYMDTPVADGIWKYSIIYDIWGTSPTELYAVGWGSDNGSAFDIFLKNSGGSTWTEDTSYPGSVPLLPESVTGFSQGDVYIGGSEGVYRLKNGTWGNWDQILSGTTSYNAEAWSRKIWGTSNASVWFVGGDGNGSLIHYNGDTSSTLSTISISRFSASTGIFGTSDTDFFISGQEGMILHVAGGAVSSMTMIPHAPVRDVCGSSITSLYAVGDGGGIFSYDGLDWKPMASPSNNDLYAVCGTGSSLFATGAKGTVLYYDGSTWSTVLSGTSEDLSAVWCLGTNSAYVVGNNGTILQCGATTCTTETTDGTTKNLHAVYHSDLGSFAAGEEGIVLEKLDSTNTWTAMTSTDTDKPASDIRDLWGDADAGILVTVEPSSIHKYTVNTDDWTKEYETLPPASQSLEAIIGTTWSDLYVVGSGSDVPDHEQDGIILHRQNGEFTPIKFFPSYHFTSAWMASGNLVVGASDYGQFPLYRFDGTRWLGMAGHDHLNNIGGSSRNNLMVVGDGGLVMHYDGTAWSSMIVEDTTNEDLNAVYVSDSGKWTLYGSWNKFFRYDGNGWSEPALPEGSDFSGFWGSGDRVFAVGNGIILSSDNSGQNWQTEAIPDSSSMLASIWGAGYSGPFYAAGRTWDGTQYHATLLTRTENGSWTAMQPHGVDYMALGDMWGSSARNIYVVGETTPILGENETEILHFNGISWASDFYSHNILPPRSLSAITGTGTGDVFAFGSRAMQKDKCSQNWQAMDAPGIPPLTKVWGVDGGDGFFYIFGVGKNSIGLGDSIYQYTFSLDGKCSSPWALFLPAILSRHQ